MRIVAKRMPATGNYRLLFSNRNGERPVGELFVDDSEKLKEFLTSKLEVPSSHASHMCTDLESFGSGFLENIQLNDAELKLTIKAYEQELAEAK